MVKLYLDGPFGGPEPDDRHVGAHRDEQEEESLVFLLVSSNQEPDSYYWCASISDPGRTEQDRQR